MEKWNIEIMNTLLMKILSLTMIVGLSFNLAASEEIDFSSIPKYKELRYACAEIKDKKQKYACHKEIKSLLPTYLIALKEMNERVSKMR